MTRPPIRYAVDLSDLELIADAAAELDGMRQFYVDRPGEQDRISHIVKRLHEAVERAAGQNENEVSRLKLRVEKLRGMLKTASGWCFDMTSDDSQEYDWLKRAEMLLDSCGDMERPNA